MAGSEPAQYVRPNKQREAEERRLIEAAQSDPARFADVYEKYFALVYAYVARRVRHRDEAEDLTAEVFSKALANLPRFKWRGAPFAAWLFRITSNLMADRAKRVAMEGKVALEESEPSLTAPTPAGLPAWGPRVGPGPSSGSGSPQTQHSDLEDSERRAQLFRLVDELAEDQRRV